MERILASMSPIACHWHTPRFIKDLLELAEYAPDVYQALPCGPMFWRGIRSLPGARFLEECRGQQSGSRGDLFRSGGLPMLKPPSDGLYKHRRDKVWYKLV
jgi:hypothetical protein